MSRQVSRAQQKQPRTVSVYQRKADGTLAESPKQLIT
jgi:hypothetical protein